MRSNTMLMLLLAVASMVHAQAKPQTLAHVFRLGNNLQRECSGFNSSSFTTHEDGTIDITAMYSGCFEYILGVSDDIQMGSKDVVCLPTGVIASSVVLVVTKYIDAHPEELHKSAVAIVRKALSSAFPCR